jgi:hypothetical protein
MYTPELIRVYAPPTNSENYKTGDVLYMYDCRWVWIVGIDGGLSYVNACDNPIFPGPKKPKKKRPKYRLWLDEYHCFQIRKMPEEKKKKPWEDRTPEPVGYDFGIKPPRKRWEG